MANAEPNLLTLAKELASKDTVIKQDLQELVNSKDDRKQGVRYTPTQRRILRDVEQHCGACVAAHAAKILQAKPRKVATLHLDMDVEEYIGTNFHDEVPEGTWMHNTTIVRALLPETITVHEFIRGIEAIQNILQNGKDFKQWCKTEGRRFAGSISQTAIYLMDRCGAPADCFGAAAWPDDIEPAEVFRTAHKRNFA